MGDLILGLILLIALLDGWRRGIIKIAGSFGGVLVGVFIARRLTPLLLPWLAQQFKLQIYGNVAGHTNSALLASWFYTESALGHLLELVIFVVLTAAITWLVRFLVNAFGSVVNATPLIGYISRALGAFVELFLYAAIIYFIYVWLLPWLISLLPELATVNTLFTSSKVVLGLILDIGSLIWYSAMAVI